MYNVGNLGTFRRMVMKENSGKQLAKKMLIAFLKEIESGEFNNLNENDFGITYEDYCKVLEIIYDNGFAKDMYEIPVSGCPYNQYKLLNIRLTLEGIDYLIENSAWAKAYKGIKEIKSWIPGL